MKSTIIVLEDMPRRVQWLKSNFSECDIVWCTTVREFFSTLRTAKIHPDLIILDHDLGHDMITAPEDEGIAKNAQILIPSGQSWPMDTNGEDGMSAVNGLDPWSDVPALVWSINSIRAPEMVQRLKEKGFDTAWVPFFSTNYSELHRIISLLV